jgi:hypothetical protein
VELTAADVVGVKTVEPVAGVAVDDGAAWGAVDDPDDWSSRVTRKTAKARTKPAATTMITWPARSFIFSFS